MNKKHEQILYYKIHRFTNKYKLTNSYDLRNLIKDLKIPLITYNTKAYNELIDLSRDGFSVRDNNDFYIFINPNMPKLRKNFTLAHELGHIVLNHHRLSRRSILASRGDDIFEQQANIFARNILMPTKEVIELKEFKSNNELAEIFEVSPSMVKVRLKYLEYDHVRLKFFNQ